jgi:hypothetical protein
MIEGSGSISVALTKRIWIRILEAQNRMDPPDPDPQHWVSVFFFAVLLQPEMFTLVDIVSVDVLFL